MKRRSKIMLGVAIAVIGLLAVLTWYGHRAYFGGPMRFDSAIYSAAGTATPGAPFSYDDYAATLKAYVDDEGMVNYQKLKQDHKKLDEFLLAMARLDPKTYGAWDAKARIAFWVNAYNALTLRLILDNYPIKANALVELAFPTNSIQQIPGRWDKVQWLVMGQKLTLDQIEHGILRGQNQELGEKYGKFHEPRIHMALVCAAMSCPRLRNEPYTGAKLDEQLDDQAKEFMANPATFRIDRPAGKVYVSRIFGAWFGGDFVKAYGPKEGFAGHSEAEKAYLNFCAKYVSTEDAQYLKDGTYAIETLDYDWSLNEQKQASDG
jgi:hypothetical protein